MPTKSMALRIDRNSPVPLYHQLAQQISAAIEAGRLGPGDPIENEVTLAERLGVSRPTVRQAIGELVTRGMLVRRRGVGTTVAGRMVHRKVELTSLHDDLSRAGRHPRTDVLALDTAAVDETAAMALNLPVDTPLVALERVRYAGDVPLAVLRNWLPPIWRDLVASELEAEGLYTLMRDRGIWPSVAHQHIGARTTTARERRLLRVSHAMPVLTMTRRASDSSGVPVEYGVHCYRADQYSIDVAVFDH